MARVLAISSQVVRGHVGLSAIVPGLQRLGHEVLGLPTVLLSNHPGHAHVAGERIGPDLLARMLEALEKNGWLGEVEAVLTGYLPSVAHVELAAGAIARVRRLGRTVRVLCDPVLGDDPKGIYVEPAVAEAIRDRLLPEASLITPNRFELAHLAGRPVAGVHDAVAAAVSLPVPVLATSIPVASQDAIANVLVTPEGHAATMVARRDRVPHGTGDLMAALVLGHWLSGSLEASLASATAGIDAVVEASLGRDELHLALPDDAWTRRAPWPVMRIG